jgi:hypothetical protein
MTATQTRQIYVIDEVVHFGGFFQGDTVGLKAHPMDDAAAEQTVTVDDHIWDNLADKHNLRPGMALSLRFHLGDVAEASVLGHADREELRQAIKGRNISPNPNLRAIAYHCKRCGLWIAQEPQPSEGGYACSLCGSSLSNA